MADLLTDPKCLLLVFAAVACGIVVGALPGLTATMGVALMVPFTYSMDMHYGLPMLMGIYCSAVYGGSISAILLNTPGTPAAAATVMDGYTMAKNGQAGRALSMSVFASTVGGATMIGYVGSYKTIGLQWAWVPFVSFFLGSLVIGFLLAGRLKKLNQYTTADIFKLRYGSL